MSLNSSGRVAPLHSDWTRRNEKGRRIAPQACNRCKRLMYCQNLFSVMTRCGHLRYIHMAGEAVFVAPRKLTAGETRAGIVALDAGGFAGRERQAEPAVVQHLDSLGGHV